ncbi:MAG: hypothetical protein WC621_04120 [Patescibacteria group bacterium]
MYDHNNQKNSSLIWMMLICLLLLVVLLFTGGKLLAGGYLWPVLIGVFVIAHLWMMFKGHKGHSGHSDANRAEKSNLPVPLSPAPAGATLAKQPEAKDEHKHGGCCH